MLFICTCGMCVVLDKVRAADLANTHALSQPLRHHHTHHDTINIALCRF